MSDFWDQRYTEHPAVYGWEPNGFLVSVTGELAESSRIVCLGEGYGRNALWLAQRGHSVTMVDSSRVAIGQSNKKAHELGLHIDTVCEDLETYQPPTCDVVVAIFIHLQPNLRRLVHERSWNALVKGGRFIMECFRKEQIQRDSGGPRNLDMLYSLNDLKSDFPSAEFAILAEETTEISEGPFHSGPAEVIRMLARKPE
jgi:hypothetical protein